MGEGVTLKVCGMGNKATMSLTKSLHRTAKGEKELREEKPGNSEVSRESQALKKQKQRTKKKERKKKGC